MATLQPRTPYTPEELKQLYPSQLQLKQVQIVLRHGERTPVSARFQNAGLPTYWPYCQHAQQMKDIILAGNTSGTSDSDWETLKYKRVLETLDKNGQPTAAKGSHGEMEGICLPGELTTHGRLTTLQLGQRLRHLYVDQLKFLPPTLSDASTITLRSTPIQRALESVQQTFTGLYPTQTRSPTLPTPSIIARSMSDETLFPNQNACKRFNELFWAYADRAAKRWNDTEDMNYINAKIGKWMPEGRRIGVDSKPRLNGIMDTVNATRSHGNATKLPSEFYDEGVLQRVDKICSEEWYKGYEESREFRRLGSGSLIGDLTARMLWHVERSTGRESEKKGIDPTREPPRLLLAGAHDTTLAGILASLGAWGSNPWPPFTSHVAVELFSTKDSSNTTSTAPAPSSSWSSFLPSFLRPTPTPLASTPTTLLPRSDRDSLQRHYVRLRYNSVPAVIPGCTKPGRHLDGDPSFCTLDAFKQIVEDITPKDWRGECRLNLGKGIEDWTEKPGFIRGVDAEADAVTSDGGKVTTVTIDAPTLSSFRLDYSPKK
ncbi:MAG: hypothetical protein Q9162_002805 [Coniocarpon cinnabarinum]